MARYPNLEVSRKGLSETFSILMYLGVHVDVGCVPQLPHLFLCSLCHLPVEEGKEREHLNLLQWKRQCLYGTVSCPPPLIYITIPDRGEKRRILLDCHDLLYEAQSSNKFATLKALSNLISGESDRSCEFSEWEEQQHNPVHDHEDLPRGAPGGGFGGWMGHWAPCVCHL